MVPLTILSPLSTVVPETQNVSSKYSLNEWISEGMNESMNEKNRLILVAPLSKTLGTLNYDMPPNMPKTLQTLLLVLRATLRRSLLFHFIEEETETHQGKWLAQMLHHI